MFEHDISARTRSFSSLATQARDPEGYRRWMPVSGELTFSGTTFEICLDLQSSLAFGGCLL